MTVLDEVLDRRHRTPFIIHEHGIEGEMRHPCVEQHEGQHRLVKGTCRLVCQLGADEQHPRSRIVEDSLDAFLIVSMTAIEVDDGRLVTALAALILDALQKDGKEGRIGEDFAAVTVCHDADALDLVFSDIASFLREAHDLLGCRRIDAALLVQGVRYGSGRKARKLAEFLDADLLSAALHGMSPSLQT